MGRGAAINTYGTYYRTLRAEETRRSGANEEGHLLQVLQQSEDGVTFSALQSRLELSPMDLAETLRHLSQVGLVCALEASGGDEAFQLTPEGQELARRRAA